VPGGAKRASMTSYLQATHVFKSPTTELLVCLGTYHDDVVRCPEGWRIARRFLSVLTVFSLQSMALA
jgi:hypothetical protein